VDALRHPEGLAWWLPGVAVRWWSMYHESVHQVLSLAGRVWGFSTAGVLSPAVSFLGAVNREQRACRSAHGSLSQDLGAGEGFGLEPLYAGSSCER
jgi:hypothetical protein